MAWKVTVHKAVLLAVQREALWIRENFGAAARARFERRITASLSLLAKFPNLGIRSDCGNFYKVRVDRYRSLVYVHRAHDEIVVVRLLIHPKRP